ncbi:Transcription elongation factor SPT5 [Astathelohania contejeani]|uniref:Chromatin elongation factor SPT5 n=1 Tax=Astathelohania contejeani TaxID=164912 RepID=A0ABQ7I125_9MICR|nr:Transcription elongation factor SPT5 [Thelohania contejeani]
MARKKSSDKLFNKYIDIEAYEDDEESYYSEEDLDAITEEEEELSSVSHENIPRRDWRTITDEWEEKYADEEEEEEEYTEEIQQHALLPTVRSPKLWLVRVRPGRERESAAMIVEKNKNGNFEKVGETRKNPEIFSIVVKQGLPGYIYIEAYTKNDVLTALEEVRGFRRAKVSVVPLREMVDVMSYRETDREQLRIGSFCRIKKGRYKGDLGRVVNIISYESVRIQIVPRLNGVKSLFKVEDYPPDEIAKSRGYFIYRRETYKNGFLEKDVLVSNLEFENVDPTFEELSIFNIKIQIPSVGDKVLVRNGELAKTVGTVETNESNMICIKTKMGSFKVPVESVEKFYEVGDEVSYKKDGVLRNGVIVKTEPGKLIVASEDFSQEDILTPSEVSPPVRKIEDPQPKTGIIRARRDPFLYKAVEIQGGEFKGYYGIVKDAYGDNCRVQLSSNLNYVVVPRDMLSIRETYGISGNKVYYNTPGFKTPGFKTPGYKTPGYTTPGYKTPGYKTPGYKTPSALKSTIAQEDYGTEWLEKTTPFQGVLVLVDGNEVEIDDIKDGIYISGKNSYKRESVSFICPDKFDKACILEGEDAGTTGILVRITGNDGIMRTSDGSVKNVIINTLTKMK